MDLKKYYNEIREKLEELDSDFVVVASLATADGGKAGVLTEVSKHLAAKLIVDKRAELATAEQTAEYYQRIREHHEEAREEEERGREAASLFSRAGMEALRKTLGLAD